MQLARIEAQQSHQFHGWCIGAIEGVPFREIAETMGRHLDMPTTSVEPEHALEHFGFLGPLAALDSPVSASITRELLGWEPGGPTLLEDLEQGHYFRSLEGSWRMGCSPKPDQCRCQDP